MYVFIIDESVKIYPFLIEDLRKIYPQTSFPENLSDELLAEWGVFPVSATPMPGYDLIKENVAEGIPIKGEIGWVQTWNITEATPEEIAKRIEQHNQKMEQSRKDAYQKEADPLFFKWQRGESTEKDWLDKVNEIKSKYPEVTS